MKAILSSALIVSLLASPAVSESIPSKGTLDQDIRRAVYKDGQVYRIETTLNNATSIEFAQNERITSVVAGDTVSFKVSSVPGGRALALKPTRSGVSTNLIVYTTRRTYYFNVRSGKSRRYTAIRFTYPASATSSTANRGIPSTAKAYKNDNYGQSRRRNFSPSRVYDDGTFTYFKFPKNAEMPAVFKYLNGKEQAVNSTVRGDGILRVSGVSRQWVLRIGEKEICITDLSKEPSS